MAAGLIVSAPVWANPVAPDVQATNTGQTDDLPLDSLISPNAAESASLAMVLPSSEPSAHVADASLLTATIIRPEQSEVKSSDVVAPAETVAPSSDIETTTAIATLAAPAEVSQAAPSSVLKTLDGKPWSPVATPAAIPAPTPSVANVDASVVSAELEAQPVAGQAAAPAPLVVANAAEAGIAGVQSAAPLASVLPAITIEASVVSPTPSAPIIIPVTSPAAEPSVMAVTITQPSVPEDKLAPKPVAPAIAAAAPLPVRASLAPRNGAPVEPEATLQDVAFTSNAADAPPVDWRSIIAPSDKERLAKLTATRRAAIKQAEAAIDGGNKAAIAAAPSTSSLIYATPIRATDADLLGEFRCRVTALGGPAPKLVLYKYATCRIEQWPNGTLVIEKTSGTDRFIGRLWREADSSYIYLGANFPEEGAVWAYNDNPAQNQAGRLYRIGANRLRLELPKPNASTGLNVVDLVRQK